ncbi:MAG: MBL fold metallo-hydrolase [Chloroflexia bacterium]|nr:MBL fold metallo-hydrolase [Chloroflexia bacterium]
MAEFRWYGHNCFRIRGKDAVVMTDPVGKGTGFSLAKQTADVVTVSSAQPELANLAAVKPEFDTIDGPGEYEIHDVFVTGIRTHRDEELGTVRGHNTSYLIELDGMVICHLGDLGHALTEEHAEAMTDVDVLLIPAGSRHLDPARAAEIAGQLTPKVVIPMQYASGSGDRDLLGLESFCRNLGVAVPAAEEKLTVKPSDLGDTMRLVVLAVS